MDSRHNPYMKNKETLDEIFCANLRRLLDARAISQSALHRSSGVTQTALSAILRGQVSPKLSTVDQICRGLRIAPWKIMIPDFPPELLPNERIGRIVSHYARMAEPGRAYIDRVAEQEANYVSRQDGPD